MALPSSAAGSVQSPSRAGEEEHRIQPVPQVFLRLGAAMGVGQAGAASTSNPNVGIDLCQCSSAPSKAVPRRPRKAQDPLSLRQLLRPQAQSRHRKWSFQMEGRPKPPE